MQWCSQTYLHYGDNTKKKAIHHTENAGNNINIKFSILAMVDVTSGGSNPVAPPKFKQVKYAYFTLT